MAKHMTHAEFTRQLTCSFNEQTARAHRTVAEFAKLGRVPKHWPEFPVHNPLDSFLIRQASSQVPKCGCLRLHCKICGFVAFHARVRSITRPFMMTPKLQAMMP